MTTASKEKMYQKTRALDEICSFLDTLKKQNGYVLRGPHDLELQIKRTSEDKKILYLSEFPGE